MPWGDVEGALLACEHYWVSTVSPDGAPSVRPVWGTWLDDRLLLSVGSTTIGNHLETNDKVTVHLESAVDVVIVEGTAGYETDPDVLARFCERYNPKYSWNFTPETTGWVVAVRPARILAWRTVPVAECHPGMTTFPLAGAQFRP
jgi:hypothetical protein